MDKYTVDLDQVLNDFEYSELTDQQQPSTTPTTHSFKNSNIKHSINNVFHSLNEYLNSDISPKCEVKPTIPETSVSGGEQSQDNNQPTPEIEPVEEEVTLSDVSINEEKTEVVEAPPEVEETPPPPTIGFEEEVDLDDAEVEKYLEDLEKEYEEDKEETCDVEYQADKEENCNVNESGAITEEEESENISSIRPNNLPLNTETEEEKQEVIDLVGEPGSTPFNNVYIDEVLPKQQQEEKPNSDTECSTSASPTFSDISTETNSSCTPSTDTVNDDTETPKNPTETVQEEEIEETPPAPPPPETTSWLGKQAPLWIPDADALNCLHCETKFTVIKRRHHCRACGLVLCSKCCNLKHPLSYLDNTPSRVCNRCYAILTNHPVPQPIEGASSGSESNSPRMPNPNNPLEYCSTVPPPLQQGGEATPPVVMVPVGVLKRKGSGKARANKSVMFCDGIRPGSDLTNLDQDFGYRGRGPNGKFPMMDQETKCFVPKGEDLPPTVTINKMDVSYLECSNGPNVVEMLKNETLTFALQTNLFVHVRIINMDCCINKISWCFSTEGLINVGQDEIVILLELLDDEKTVPKDIFLHINNIYLDAVKGNSVKEMGLSLHNTTSFLGSKNHAGFLYIKPSFQCLQNVIKPQEQFLIGILIHRWETPWAKLFPLRLILRLGAEYRYYPSPIISNRYRDSVFVEIGHTIINLLADFRNFSYTLPQIRGLTIHMEDKNTTVTIPTNCYDQVMKSINNSSDHILAFAGNFSNLADSHLVCIQDTQSNENAYSTHAINIHNKPRKVTGASFIVFNGALKSSSGLTAKSSIVEDGLMIQIPAEHLQQIRESLRNMKDHTIQCGVINAASDETVNIVWGEPDILFNVNVYSPIDNKPLEGVPSIRVHNGKDYINGNRLIRWTEVFVMQIDSGTNRTQEPVNVSKVSDCIAKAACTALVKYLDLLVSNSFYKIGIRANYSNFFVAYAAGSNGVKLPPIYMESLDNELIPVLHKNAANSDENPIILELIFRILNKQ